MMAPLISGERHTHEQEKKCRVAISISGDARSFVDPAVHRSFRHYVVEAIETNGCQVDVFAYAMLEDDVDILLVSIHFVLYVSPSASGGLYVALLLLLLCPCCCYF